MGGGRFKSVGPALEAYRRKRDAGRTPEPSGGGRPLGGVQSGGLFVVQKHAARNLHFDLRLEIGGVLQSWAVPKGPSADPEVKRLAMQVEQHPLEYASFEGLIPEGNYGAGSVIVWDRGVVVHLLDPAEGLRNGKLLFDLHGHKLRGRWTLFRIGKKPNEWLWMKKPDAESGKEVIYPESSILSGLTVDQLETVPEMRRALRRRLRGRAEPADGSPRDWKPMLARGVSEPPLHGTWVHEIKYDGYRMLAARNGTEASLTLRNGGDATRRAPEIVEALRHLPADDFAIDAEWVALDAEGRPDFAALQRGGPRGTVLFAFDLLRLEGFDVTSLPLTERKKLLKQILPETGPLRYVDHLECSGADMVRAVAELQLEGVVSKNPKSTYRPGRSDDWQKTHVEREAAFAIAGYRPEKGRKRGMGALELALRRRDGSWISCGSVGSGLGESTRKQLLEELRAPQSAGPTIAGLSEGSIPVEIERACRIRFREWTRAGRLRHPVFLGLIDDDVATLNRYPEPQSQLKPDEIADANADAESATERDEDAERGAEKEKREQEREVPVTNPDKLFWPEDGYTKADLVHYYRSVSRWMLPYLRDRPVVLQRYPDGIHGKNFFQKDAPEFAPDWIDTHAVWTESSGREIRYFVCRSEAALTYLINLGAIPLHIWSSRVRTPNQPDWSILDLDPGEADFTAVVKIARFLHRTCDEIGLPNYVKTSGSKGLHVLIPMGPGATYEQSRSLAELLATYAVRELPEIATVARARSARNGRVYIDYLQNGGGSLIVAPFSVRPLVGAPVSMPLRWSEVRPSLKLSRHNIRSAVRRLSRLGQDPLRPIFRDLVDWPAVLTRLDRQIAEGN